MKLHSRKAFTLVEVLIYSALLVVVSTLLVSILGIVARIGNTTSSASEVAAQANFILQNIGRMVAASSAVDVDLAGQTILKIYNKDYAMVPTTVTLVGGNIVVTDASGSAPLNTSKVVVNTLTFKRMINSGGFDTIGVDLTLSFNTNNPQQMLTRSLSTAISRASAATFDGGLFPNASDSLDVGAAGSRWANGFFSGNLAIGGGAGVGLSSAPLSPILLEVAGGVRINTALAKPGCGASSRGTFWVTQGGAGVKDSVQVCAKDVAEVYAWRTIY